MHAMTTTARSATWLVVAAALVIGMMLAPLPEDYSFGWRAHLLDLGHVPLFLLLTLFFLRGLRWPRAWGVLAAMTLAGASEWGQLLTGRNANWPDFTRSLLGILLAVILDWAIGHPKRWTRLPSLLAIVALLAWPVYAEGPWLWEAWQANREFPQLASPQRWTNRVAWTQKQATVIPERQGEVTGMRLVLLPGADSYPTVEMVPLVADWRGYSKLCLDLTTKDSFTLTLVVKDRREKQGYTQRFNRYLPLQKGTTHLCLPLEEIAKGPTGDNDPLDLGRIGAVQFYLDDPTTAHNVWIGNIHLE